MFFTRLTRILHPNVAGHPRPAVYAARMENSSPGKLAMYLAVKAVCDAKPSVWQRSEAFAEAFTDFCACLENLIRLRPGAGIFNSVAKGIAVEAAVADTILTTEMDELIEQFEAVDVAFVYDYTAARSMDFTEEIFAPAPLLPASGRNGADIVADRGQPLCCVQAALARHAPV
jgi:hypothetical protein